VDFAWDPKKARRNLIKHGISFEEAGESRPGRLLVAYTETGDAIRIINARKATRRERKVYEEGV
jgi:uncharacterized protein